MGNPSGRGFSGTEVMQGGSVPSSNTINIWGEGSSCHISGTTTITSLGTANYVGATKRIIFDGALTLTHSANLNLPSAANITTAAGDSCIVYADTTTQLDVLSYTRANGAPLSVTEASLGASIVSQGKLKSTNGVVSVAQSASANLTLPGGAYGLYPQLRSGLNGSSFASVYMAYVYAATTSYVTNIYLSTDVTVDTYYAQQQYIQASPPYDLGDGEIPLFIFALVKPNGDVAAAYVAPEAPWHYNGPTDIRADRYIGGRGYKMEKEFIATHGSVKAALAKGMTRDQIAAQLAENKMVEIEITQSIKNADMGRIPHPFGTIPVGYTVVMLDPVSPLVGKLSLLHEAGDDINEHLHDGNLIISNATLIRATPTGVSARSVRWKLT